MPDGLLPPPAAADEADGIAPSRGIALGLVVGAVLWLVGILLPVLP